MQTKIDSSKQKISSLDELLGVEPDPVDLPKIKSLASSALTFLMLGKKTVMFMKSAIWLMHVLYIWN